jgi:copper chaperone CopZ
MHCKSCSEVITDELMGMDCVENAEVFLSEGTAEVQMREDCTKTIIETVQSLGYTARVLE